MQVEVIDTRPEWMLMEDAEYKCMFLCSMRRNCTTKHGADCKVQGGKKIPKIRDRRG